MQPTKLVLWSEDVQLNIWKNFCFNQNVFLLIFEKLFFAIFLNNGKDARKDLTDFEYIILGSFSNIR